MKITLYDAVNPLAFGKRISDDPALVDWWRDHAPERDHRVQIISRRDASDLTPDEFVGVDRRALGMQVNGEYLCGTATRRKAVEELLRSYSAENVCKTLIARGVPRDWNGVVMLDHETQGTKSHLAWLIYKQLESGIHAVFPNVNVRQYAAYETQRIGPSDEHDWRFASRNGSVTFAYQCVSDMPCMYIPPRWLELTVTEVEWWTKHAMRHVPLLTRITEQERPIPLLSPIVEGTHEGTDYSTGQPVPLWLMTQVIRTLADLGFTTLAVWGATANADQAGRTIELIQSVIVPAVDAVEGGGA